MCNILCVADASLTLMLSILSGLIINQYVVGTSDDLCFIPTFDLSSHQMMQKASNGIEYNITKSFVFMDKEFTLPTSMGLPVRCNMNGTASVSLRLRGKAGLQLPKIYAAGRIAPR